MRTTSGLLERRVYLHSSVPAVLCMMHSFLTFCFELWNEAERAARLVDRCTTMALREAMLRGQCWWSGEAAIVVSPCLFFDPSTSCHDSEPSRKLLFRTSTAMI